MKVVGNTIKILHLEDAAEDAELVARALKQAKMDCEILVVDKRAAFIQELRRFMPDIILSDHSLPSFNSLEAVSILKYAGLKIPFILVTGHSSDEYVAGLMDAGMDDYILKDRLARLPQAILHALERYRLEERLQKAMQEKAAARLQLFDPNL
jgi:CheY-like chemotaxis protein